jgi:hypothetical protein
MAKDAQVVRRPWCLCCIDAFLGPDAATVTPIQGSSGASPSWSITSVQVRFRDWLLRQG